MKLATFALGLALSAPLAAAAPTGPKARLHPGGGIQRIEVNVGQPGWTFKSDATAGVHVTTHKDGTATLLVMDHVLASGGVVLTLEKDGEVRTMRIAHRA